MLANHFVSSKNRGASMKIKVKSLRKNAGLEKKQNSDMACWATEKT